jgi:hypothetical protein
LRLSLNLGKTRLPLFLTLKKYFRRQRTKTRVTQDFGGQVPSKITGDDSGVLKNKYSLSYSYSEKVKLYKPEK